MHRVTMMRFFFNVNKVRKLESIKRQQFIEKGAFSLTERYIIMCPGKYSTSDYNKSILVTMQHRADVYALIKVSSYIPQSS